ncbi:MAG: flagellar basal body P-ring formation chaperone FlgA [Azospirillaceae bacterium]|nr:flagellar basal body P-ring formation chaperone FlgA [Azospirillaceae bacterium]
MSRFTPSRMAGLLIAGAMSMTAWFPAWAIDLRSETVVNRDKVTLGDLFDNIDKSTSGYGADQVIGAAPAPGKRGLYDAAYLMKLAEVYQLPWRPGSPFDRVVVTRASSLVPTEAIRAALVDALRPQLRLDRIDVELDNHGLQITVPETEDPPQLALDDLTLDSGRTRFNGTMVATVAGADPVRVVVTGRVSGIVRIPILTRSIPQNDVISASDVDWIDVRSDRLYGDILSSDSQLIGMQSRHQLAPNQPLHLYDVRPQIFVTKGSLVTLTIQTPFLSISTQGRAMEDGAKGQVIRLVNTTSNKSVEGTVTGLNVVAISPPGSIMTN